MKNRKKLRLLKNERMPSLLHYANQVRKIAQALPRKADGRTLFHTFEVAYKDHGQPGYAPIIEFRAYIEGMGHTKEWSTPELAVMQMKEMRAQAPKVEDVIIDTLGHPAPLS